MTRNQTILEVLCVSSSALPTPQVIAVCIESVRTGWETIKSTPLRTGVHPRDIISKVLLDSALRDTLLSVGNSFRWASSVPPFGPAYACSISPQLPVLRMYLVECGFCPLCRQWHVPHPPKACLVPALPDKIDARAWERRASPSSLDRHMVFQNLKSTRPRATATRSCAHHPRSSSFDSVPPRTPHWLHCRSRRPPQTSFGALCNCLASSRCGCCLDVLAYFPYL